jgi:hypothetical protein
MAYRLTIGLDIELKAKFGVNPSAYYADRYQPVLPEEHVVRIDTTDLDAVDVADIADRVRERLSTFP